MERISVIEASRTLPDLVDRVVREGIMIDLERDDHVVARLTPAPAAKLTVADLNRVFAGLPSLGDDAEDFARDVEKVRRELPKEVNPWD
jgi:antitoxin (DNA-binding transcriptional repressor) of toxin-antitoxin stability system